MSIGLGALRSRRHAGRGRTMQPTVREVCLLGMARRARNEAWTAGQKIVWLGRGYQVVALSNPRPAPALAARAPSRDDSDPAGALHYVHLAPCDGSGAASAPPHAT
jgi:hypothetical protein